MKVRLDGGFVRSREAESQLSGWFELIAGRRAKAEGGNAKCFAFVQRYDPKPRRRLYAVLKAQGLQGHQLVTFLSDGGDVKGGTCRLICLPKRSTSWTGSM
jgi:hypothetical protein